MSTIKNGKTVGKVIAYILVLLVVVGIVGLVVRFTGGFTSDFKTFYVSVDGKDILTTAEGYTASIDEPLAVDVKYTFGAMNDEVSGYSVKVVPNPTEGKDFDFTLDGMAYSYQAEKDLTAGFEIEKSENSFTLKPKGGITDVLKAVYPNSEIEDCRDKSYMDMYALVITSYNGQSSVTVCFSITEQVMEVILDKEVIVF